MKFNIFVAVLTLTCGSEILIERTKEAAKAETAEMKSLRCVAGCTKKDQIRNTKIMEELNIFYLNNKILKFSLQWKYHVQRMKDWRIPKKIVTCILGCPQLSWGDLYALQEDGTDNVWPNP
jgi:hypothetical protein